MTTSLLTFSNLYPNETQPGLGLFVETRLLQLMRGRDYAARVVAPVPWFPFTHPRFGKFSAFAGVPHSGTRHGIQIDHPRYLHVPKIGMHTAPAAMGRAGVRLARAFAKQGFIPNLIDAHYFYPDAVAAARVARSLDRPLMVTARGSDINLITQYARPLRLMRETAAQADAIVAVSSALANRMADLGFGSDKIHVLRNGVDLEYFGLRAQDAAREQLGVQGRVLLSVGNLIELKGHHLIIDAIRSHEDVTLLIAGEGPFRAQLEDRILQFGLAHRVRLLGQQSRNALRTLYAAADMLVLASSREGLANVLLESVASGLPVVATDVGGNAEVVSDAAAGRLVTTRTPEAIWSEIEQLYAQYPGRQRTRQFAQKFGWGDTCHRLDGLIQRIMAH
ncbi:MAG: glycosyltransferase [Pseudomonadota bacterium]